MLNQNNQQLPAIPVEKIEFLKQLPAVLSANKDLFNKAFEVCKPVLDKITGIDFTKADLTATNQLETEANDLQVRLRSAKEKAEARRKPSTAVMDEIKTLFTANEKEFDDIFNQLKVFRDKWNQEKAHRNNEAEREKQKAIAKKQEETNYFAAASTHFMKRLFEVLASRKKAMAEQFSTLNLSNIDKFESTYREWNPALMQNHIDYVQKDFSFNTTFLSEAEKSNLFFKAFNDSMKSLEKEYVDQMTAEKNRILEMVPAKQTELINISKATPELAVEMQQQAAERDQEEQKRQADLLKQKEQEKITDISAQAQAQSVAGMFGVLTSNAATPVAAVSKGTKQKQSIKITSNAGWLAILQLYGLKRVPAAPLEALEKELKSVLKWAIEYLNEGGEIPISDGIQVEKVFSTTAKAVK